MRLLMAPLLLLTLSCLYLLADAHQAVQAANELCCENITHMKIPWKNVQSYSLTSSTCEKKAIIFKTVRRQFCVDPKVAWAGEYMKALDQRIKATTEAKSAASSKP